MIVKRLTSQKRKVFRSAKSHSTECTKVTVEWHVSIDLFDVFLSLVDCELVSSFLFIPHGQAKVFLVDDVAAPFGLLKN